MTNQKPNSSVTSRRHLLKIGTMAAPAVITLAPASARAATSVLHCFVPFPANVNTQGQECSPSVTSDSSYSPGKGKKKGHGEEEAAPKCLPGPDRGGLNAVQIQNGFGLDGISDDKERYDAYVAYLNNVKKNELKGVSCLMSIQISNT